MNREAFADFLKRRRDSLQPSDVGLGAGSRRRTCGLRREEVAALAHMSTDFYARLEQQRGSRPSEQTVAALTVALRLNRDERDHLFSLAGYTPPTRSLRNDQPSPGLLRVMERLDTPASIVSDLYVTLSQNRLSEALIGVQTGYHGYHRSLVYRWFTDPSVRKLFHPDDHHIHSRNWVSSIRAVHGRSDDDLEARQLVARLLLDSPEFAELWELHEVSKRASTLKRLIHPVVGPLTLDCQILTSENQTERLVVFTALQPEDARALARLSSSTLALH